MLDIKEIMHYYTKEE